MPRHTAAQRAPRRWSLVFPAGLLLTAGFFLSVAALANAAAQGDAGRPSPAAAASVILARVAMVYATASTYQDTGVVQPTGSGAGRFSDTPFSTAYRAPDRFRFEFTPMLDLAIARATGVSSSSAHAPGDASPALR